MKTVLVTGARGLLGSACVRALTGDYLVVDSNGVDLTKWTETVRLFDRARPNYVIHCAAKVGGVKANRDFPVDFIEQNVAINSNVFSAAHKYGVEKLVNIATSCLYPKNAPVPVKEESLLTGPFEPDVSAYATAKLLGYASCNAYRHQYGCSFITVCPSNIYGPGDNYGPSAHVIPALVNRLFEAQKAGKPLTVWGDGSAVREFIYSDDAAKAIRIALERFDSPDLLNIGTGIGTSIKTIAEALTAIVGGVYIEYDPSQPVGIKEKTFDVTRLKALGWSQSVHLLDGLIRVCEDYQSRKADGTLRLT